MHVQFVVRDITIVGSLLELYFYISFKHYVQVNWRQQTNRETENFISALELSLRSQCIF